METNDMVEYILWSVLVVGVGVFAFFVWYNERDKRRAVENAAAAAKEAKRQAAKRALDEAERAYESALEELEADNSTENKKRALESGREYAALSREAHEGDKSVTLFDEVALTNDLNARIK